MPGCQHEGEAQGDDDGGEGGGGARAFGSCEEADGPDGEAQLAREEDAPPLEADAHIDREGGAGEEAREPEEGLSDGGAQCSAELEQGEAHDQLGGGLPAGEGGDAGADGGGALGADEAEEARGDGAQEEAGAPGAEAGTLAYGASEEGIGQDGGPDDRAHEGGEAGDAQDHARISWAAPGGADADALALFFPVEAEAQTDEGDAEGEDHEARGGADRFGEGEPACEGEGDRGEGEGAGSGGPAGDEGGDESGEGDGGELGVGGSQDRVAPDEAREPAHGAGGEGGLASEAQGAVDGEPGGGGGAEEGGPEEGGADALFLAADESDAQGDEAQGEGPDEGEGGEGAREGAGEAQAGHEAQDDEGAPGLEGGGGPGGSARIRDPGALGAFHRVEPAEHLARGFGADEAQAEPLAGGVDGAADLGVEAADEDGRAGEDALAAQRAAEVGGHFLGGGVALGGLALEGGEADALEVGGCVGAELLREGGVGVLHLLDEDGGGEIVGPGGLVGEQFEEEDAQAEDIGRGGDGGPGFEGFGGGVARGASWAGEAHGPVALGAGQAKVDDGGLAPSVDEDVVGLEIAMDDALVVGGGDGVDDLQEKGEAVAPVLVAPGGAEVDAIGPLHDEVGDVALDGDIEHLAEVAVVEAAHGAGLVDQAVVQAEGGVEAGGGVADAEELDRDAPAGAGFAGAEDAAHAPGAGEVLDAVAVLDGALGFGEEVGLGLGGGVARARGAQDRAGDVLVARGLDALVGTVGGPAQFSPLSSSIPPR